jgi:hypothetical protein
MAPLPDQSLLHANAKRRLPPASFVGIAVGAGVFLIVLISITLWCYVRGWRRLRLGQARLESSNRSPPPTKTGTSQRASKYWSADDIGNATKVHVTEITGRDSKRESHVVVLPAPNLHVNEKNRQSKVVKLPPPSLRSWTSDTKDRLVPKRPTSRRVPVLSRHVSMQFKDISVASNNNTPDRTPALDDFPQPGQQWSNVVDLDWQEYRR